MLDFFIESKCDEMFEKPPIPFRPNKTKLLEHELSRLIKLLGITVPIVFISGSLYLIGPHRCNCELRSDVAMIRVGGGY